MRKGRIGKSALGDPLEAINHVRALLNEGRLDELIDASIERFTELYHGHWREYTQLVNSIPSGDLTRFPEISVIAAAAASWFEPHTALGWARVEHAVALMRARNEDHPDPRRAMRSAGVELGAYRILSRAGEAAAAAARWEALVDGLVPDALISSAEIIHVLTVQVVGAYAQEGRFEEAVRAWSRMREDTNTWRQVHAQSMVALSHAVSGDIAAARELTRSMRTNLTEHDWRGSYNSVGWNIAAAIVAVEDGDPGGALDLLDELDGQLAAVDHWPYILAARSRALMMHRSPGEAADIMQELFSQHHGRRSSAYSVDLLRAAFADLLIASGQVERGQAILESGMPLGPSALAHSRLLLKENPVLARTRATEMFNSGKLSTRMSAEALLTQAIAANRLGLEDDARALMTRLVAGIERKGNLSVLMLAPRAEVFSLFPQGFDALAAQARALPDNNDGGIAAPVQLTSSEYRVLEMLLQYRSARELADELFVSQNTVKTHLRNIYRKLGVSDRAAAISTATRIGLLR